MQSSTPEVTPKALSRRRLLSTGLKLAGAAAVPSLLSSNVQAAGRIDARLAQLGIELPEVAAPVANYVAYQVVDGFAYIAGQIPFKDGTLLHTGSVPSEVSVDQAQAAARQCCINILAALKAACGGDLDRVRMCLRLQGFVASDDDFTGQSSVVNGASDLLVEVLGDAGKHTRLAIGVNTLPLDSCVEVSAIFAIS